MRMTDFPLVSAVITTFNSSRWIERAIESALSQSYPHIEVIVSDDGSNDDTVAKVLRYVQVDNRVRLLQSATNSGLPAVARNRAVKRANGSLLAFLDHDDVWFKKKIERQVVLMNRRPEIGMVHSHLLHTNNRSVALNLARLEPPSWRVANPESLSTRNVIQCSSVMIRADLFANLGGFSECHRFRAVEDFHLWIRVAQIARIAFIREVHGGYTEHSGGISKLGNPLEKAKALDDEFGTSFSDKARSGKRYATRIAALPFTWASYLNGAIRYKLGREPLSFD